MPQLARRSFGRFATRERVRALDGSRAATFEAATQPFRRATEVSPNFCRSDLIEIMSRWTPKAARFLAALRGHAATLRLAREAFVRDFCGYGLSQPLEILAYGVAAFHYLGGEEHNHPWKVVTHSPEDLVARSDVHGPRHLHRQLDLELGADRVRPVK